MKTFVLVPIFILCVIQTSQAQTDSVALNKFYHTWIIPKPGLRGMSGILFEVKDSSVMVSDSPWKNDYYTGDYDVSEFDIKNIDVIKVRRQGKGFALLVGGVSGLVVGGVVSAVYSKNLAENIHPVRFLFGGFLLPVIPIMVSTGIGLGVGAIFSAKTKIPIKGSQKEYERNKTKLEQYALNPDPSLRIFMGSSFSILQDSVFDIDGNVYHTLALGGQVWMAENLQVTRYRNGDIIPRVTDDAEWSNLNSSAYSDYQNDTAFSRIYGRLYNGFAIRDSHHLCPVGWHVPSQSEWLSLVNCMGGATQAGSKLKEAGTVNWHEPNKGVNPGSIFALPGGYRDYSGSFNAQGEICQWWTSTPQDSAYVHSLYLNNQNIHVLFSVSGNTSGLSVRCIRD
ncbi:MAG: fibrobacter succinogenes major paralogous domain-containing protein [Bacteroidota bacterium]